MRALLLLVAALLTVLAAGCGGGSGAGRGGRRPDVVLIVVDTLRADRLGAYGSGRPTSPRLDRLAREGALLIDATAQSSWTRPSMVSLFSGRFVTAYRDVPFEDAPTLAEVFERAGYRTMGAVGNVLVSNEAGFGRGFEHFDDRENPRPRDEPGNPLELGRDGEQLVDDLLPVVERAVADDGRAPVLVYLHLMDPHYPYFEAQRHLEELPLEGSYPLEPWHREVYGQEMGTQALPAERQYEAWRKMASMRGRYDHEVRTTDEVIERFLGRLEELGVLEHAVVALVADHGELLYDQPAPDPMRRPARGAAGVSPMEFFYRNHGVLLDQGLVHTPFLLAGAGVPAGVRIEAPVQNVDLLPTLLELCDVAPPEVLHGRSLVPWLRGEVDAPPHEYVFSFCAQNRMVREVASGWKLTLPNADFVGQPGFEPSLHHLGRDPLERDDRYDAEPEVVQRLSAALEHWEREHPVRSTANRARSQAERDALRALGYSESGPDDGLGGGR